MAIGHCGGLADAHNPWKYGIPGLGYVLDRKDAKMHAEKCPVCDGEGLYPRSAANVPPFSPQGPCHGCDGKGWIPTPAPAPGQEWKPGDCMRSDDLIALMLARGFTLNVTPPTETRTIKNSWLHID